MVDVALTLENLACGYGKRSVLTDFSAGTLTGGTVVGLLGPNACGKSTLIKTLAGVLKPLGGAARLTVGGQPVTDPRERYRRVGYVPQDLPSSAALTAYETVLISATRSAGHSSARRDAASVMCELGLDHLQGRYLNELSGGQRQMIAFAQMLVATPEVMLLDEPTSALDLNKQLFLLGQLRRRVERSGALAVVAIHDINLAARYCDELLVMSHGRLVGQGKPAELLTPELLHEVFEVQAEILDHEGVPVICATA